MNATLNAPPFACPACRSPLVEQADGHECDRCGRAFPNLDGLPDLRLDGDRYLDQSADRAKADRLEALAVSMDFDQLAQAYYAMTPDVDAARRTRYLAHLGRAELRGDALAALLPRAGTTLEVGCGSGGLLVAAARSGRSIVGVDIAARWLALARRRLRERGIEGVVTVGADAARLPWDDSAFGAVVADSVIEHLDDPAAALREWARVVQPGGSLVLWSPNRYSIAPDPHVGLLGIGWLPTRWATRYARARADRAWDVRPLSALDAAKLARGAGWEQVEVVAPSVPPTWVAPGTLRSSVHLYNTFNRSRLGAGISRSIGPLWQLTARRGGP